MIEYDNLRKVNDLFSEELKKVFSEVLDSGRFILGENLKEFEKEFSTYCEANFCAGVASGLDALIISIKALDIFPGSEIIVPSNTFIASILAIVNAGCIPVLVEPDLETYNLDPQKIEEKISSKTKAVMAVHLYGKCCDMDPIVALCNRYHLNLIEDCAQAHGAKYKGKRSGGFGKANGFSFYPAKNLGALGDGGAVTINDEAVFEKVKKLRNYGSDQKYCNEVIGYNSRLDEMQAAFLRIKLKELEKINEHKRKLASLYLEELKDDFIKPIVDKDFYDVYHIFNIRHAQRDLLKEYLLKNQIQTQIHYPIPPHKQVAFKELLTGESFPISEEIHETTLSLPISYYHSEDVILRVIETMNKF